VIAASEPPVYRPFALLAFAVALLGGIPLGLWLLGWLYLGMRAVSPPWLLLHAHLQIFGFFGTLIMGVAQHLLPRLTGRPVSRNRFLLAILGLQTAGLSLRIIGTAAGLGALILLASLLQTIAFLLFAGWVWRMLDPAPLAFLRRHLTLSTAWLAGACALEAWLRAGALASDRPLPALAGLHVAHTMGLFGGVLGWVLGVLLRAGPMFVPRWRAPVRAARALPWLQALGLGIAASGEASAWSVETATVLARLGELVILAGAAVLMLLGGVLTRAREALPLVARSPEESRIFRLAMLAGGGAVVGSAVTVAVAGAGLDVRVLADVVRHLITIGVLTSVVVAMVFRLVPVLEGRRLRWPRLRRVALWSLAVAIIVRSAELLVGLGWASVASWIPLSGVLVWLAVACPAVNVMASISARARGVAWSAQEGRR
jgi:hypothetical protein